MTSKPTSWRDVLSIHPAAELFPMMSEQELRDLGDDIKKHGLRESVSLLDGNLVDGRNRLDAMELVGLKVIVNGQLDVAWKNVQGVDPVAFVISKNIHRRHLTPEQKREVIAALLKADPGKSDRRIAKETDSNRTTVGQIRKELEDAGTCQSVDTRADSKGRKQRAHKAVARKRRDIDDYLAEKNARPPAAHDDAPGLAPQQIDPDYLIAQFIAHVRASGLDLARQIEPACWPTLIERLREVIDEIEIEADRWAKEARDEPPGIPEFLRRT
jgi:hypothetical protein